ncbi:MAG: alkaline phosphatase [Acidobacteriota bacterium]
MKSGVEAARGALVVAVVCALAGNAFAATNVIVLVPDGCSNSIQTLSRWYTGKTLTLDSMVVGQVRTHMADSVVTDSAPAATAFATGHKSSDKFIGVGPKADKLLTGLAAPPEAMRYKPLATVLEAARLKGLATGLVATSSVSHATPAAFAAHTHSRALENEIMEQIVYQDVNVVLGGGKRYLLPTAEGGSRTDGENLISVLQDRGYSFVETADQLAQVSTGKVFGMFASSAMAPEIDRPTVAPTQPSLATMTAKAIELLAQDPDGFFLMVEGSQIDWAGHANDAIYMVTDFLAFDDATRVALDFAKQHGDTLVVAFPDHDTGGLTIGNTGTGSTYTSITVEALVEPLKKMKVSGAALAARIGTDTSPANVKAQILELWGVQVSDADVTEILALKDKGLGRDYAIPEVISRNYTVIGWTGHGHTGHDVPLWAYGPGKPAGLLDNTQLATVVAEALGFDLAAVDQHLFVEATSRYPGSRVDLSDPANPVFRIGHCSVPSAKNVVRYEPLGLEIPLEGVAVHAPVTGKFYVSKLAVAVIDLLQSSLSGMSALDVEALATRMEFSRDLGFPPALRAER